MKEYTYDKPTVDAWLLNGGAEIVLEAIRRMDWTIEVLTGKDLVSLDDDDIVVCASRVSNIISINGAKSPWQQAFFAVAAVNRRDPIPDKPQDFDTRQKNWKYPFFRENDKFLESSIYLCYSFIDKIRIASEATVSLIGKAAV